MKRVLITGANRGLGLELARQALERGDFVVATLRDLSKAKALTELKANSPERVLIQQLDTTDEKTIKDAVAAASGHIDGLDVLINNAGILFEGESLEGVTAEQMMTTYQTNTVGPLLVTRASLNLLRNGDGPVVANISTRMSSLQVKSGGGSYGYSPSKTALNMVTRLMANDLRHDGIKVVSINPGWVQTDMGGTGAPVRAEDSARGILSLIDTLSPQQSGHFYDYEQREQPW